MKPAYELMRWEMTRSIADNGRPVVFIVPHFRRADLEAPVRSEPMYLRTDTARQLIADLQEALADTKDP